MQAKCEKNIKDGKKVVLDEGNSFGVSRQQFGPTAREIRMSTSSLVSLLLDFSSKEMNKTEIGSKSGR